MTAECLDDNDITAYIANALPDERRTVVIEHLSNCELCLAISCAAATDRPPSPVELGTISRYALVEILGQGAMGSVYRARDPQLDRDIALKVVNSARYTGDDVRARMSRESRAMAQVRHPNVVAVYDAGEIDLGVYIAMELIDGVTLAHWLVDTAHDWRDIVQRFISAGCGLAAAHEAGIVHRDFKPENVLVARDGRVAVTDFGVAAIGGDGAVPPLADGSVVHTDHQLTRAGTLIGTPRYMSPEQLRGERVDARSDQFSFAIALYEAVYGTPPFAGTSLEALTRTVTSGVVKSPGSTAVPVRLHRILVRALSPSRSDRFSSMTEMIEALHAATRPRHTARWIGSAAAAVVLVGAIAWLALHRGHESPPASSGKRTMFLVGVTGDDADVATAVNEAIAAGLSTSTRLDAAGGAELQIIRAQLEVKTDDVEAIATEFASGDARPLVTLHGSIARDGDGYTIDISLRDNHTKDETYHARRSANDRAHLVDTALDLASDVLVSLGDNAIPPAQRGLTSSHPDAIVLWSHGKLASASGDDKAGAELYRQALAIDPDFAIAQAALGLALYNLGDKADAGVQLDHALAQVDRMPERDRLIITGGYYDSIGRYSDSILAYQTLLARWPGDGRAEISLTSTAIDAESWTLALDVARASVVHFDHLEVVHRNLIIAQLGNDRYAEAIAEGTTYLARFPKPAGGALGALLAAYVLAGNQTEAHALLAKLPSLDPDLAASASADVAAYEGHLDVADRTLSGSAGEADPIRLALLRLRATNFPGAIEAAKLAMRDDTMPTAYLAASVAVAAGDPSGANDKIKSWSDAPEADRRMYARLLAGDLARSREHWDDAIAEYKAASRLGDSWLVHERMGRAQFGAMNSADAIRELTWCLDHRGRGALVANPSLMLLPDVEKLRNGAHANTIR